MSDKSFTNVRAKAMNNVWNQELRRVVMQTQYDALGLSVEKDQMRDLLKTSLANNPDFQKDAPSRQLLPLGDCLMRLSSMSISPILRKLRV